LRRAGISISLRRTIPRRPDRNPSKRERRFRLANDQPHLANYRRDFRRGLAMSMQTVVDAYVKIGNYQALEREKQHRQKLLENVNSDADFRLTLIRQTLENDINIIETGLAQQFRESKLRFNLETFNEELISGWAQYEDFPDTSVVLSVFFNNVLIGTSIANRFRADLLAAGIGNGHHHFKFYLPDQDRDVDRSIEVRAANGLVLAQQLRLKSG
jgi:hypothetical protein